MRTAVIDSSPLISLTHLGLCSQLTLFFDKVYVPRAVHREVNRKSRFRYRLKKLYEIGPFERCIAVDITNVRLLLDEVDEGEAEALAQATERGAAFFIGDEKRARVVGKNKGLTPVGTVRILARLRLEGRAGDTRALVRKLRGDLGFRVSDAVVRKAIALAAEPI